MWPHVPQVSGSRTRGVLQVDHEREMVRAEGRAETAVTDTEVVTVEQVIYRDPKGEDRVRREGGL